jgi:O-antigen/teichoic acid export membrane protein
VNQAEAPEGGRFGREAAIYLVGFAAVGAIQFLALPVYARVLGPQGYGQYSLTLATVTVLAGVMLLGGDAALARFWGEAGSHVRRRLLASSWIWFLTAWSLLVTGVALLAAPAVAAGLRPESGYVVALSLGLLAMAPAQLSRMFAQILRNTFQPVRFAATSALVAAMNVALSLLLGVVLGLGLVGILAGIVVGESLGCLVRAHLARDYLTRRLDFETVRPLLRFGLPIVPASLAAWAMQSTDRLVLSSAISPEELGVYGMAVSLVGPFTVVTLSLGQAWMPRVVSLYARDQASARSATASAIGYALAGFGSLAILAGAFAPLMLRLVAGADFVAGARVLPLLALGAAFGGVGLFTATGLQLAMRTPLFSTISIAAALLNVVLLLIAVPIAGMVGAAASVAVAYFSYMAATAWFAHRAFPLDTSWWRLGAMVVVLFACAGLVTARPSQLAVGVAAVTGLALLAALMPHRFAFRKRAQR